MIPRDSRYTRDALLLYIKLACTLLLYHTYYFTFDSDSDFYFQLCSRNVVTLIHDGKGIRCRRLTLAMPSVLVPGIPRSTLLHPIPRETNHAANFSFYLDCNEVFSVICKWVESERCIAPQPSTHPLPIPAISPITPFASPLFTLFFPSSRL